ncbi:MAG TPA: hypothetical protein VGN00_11150 [Puia sp.]|jgi:DNA-binding HxlR family transcriptional regulator
MVDLTNLPGETLQVLFHITGGKAAAKPAILFSLLEGKMRYSQLLKTIPGVSPGPLLQTMSDWGNGLRPQ